MHQRLLPGGMVKLELVLQPDEADLILRAVDRAREVHAEQAESPQPGKGEAAGAAESGGVSRLSHDPVLGVGFCDETLQRLPTPPIGVHHGLWR